MDRWDIFLFAAAGYVAIVSLVRLMAYRRNELVAKVRDELAKQRGAAVAADVRKEQQEQEAA